MQVLRSSLTLGPALVLTLGLGPAPGPAHPVATLEIGTVDLEAGFTSFTDSFDTTHAHRVTDTVSGGSGSSAYSATMTARDDLEAATDADGFLTQFAARLATTSTGSQQALADFSGDSAAAVAQVSFDVASPMALQLGGRLSGAGSASGAAAYPPGGTAYLSLSGVSLSYSFIAQAAGGPAYPAGTPDLMLDETLELQPGTYLLVVAATAGGVIGRGAASYTARGLAEVEVDFVDCQNEFTSGPDAIVGTPGDDVLCGGGGDDEIDGKGGNDHLLGGGGTDAILGGAGNDRIDAGPGDDTDVLGGDGNDTLQGGLGDDGDVGLGAPGGVVITFDGGPGSDVVLGEEGNDTLTGGPGGDRRLDGGPGGDLIFGQAGDDDLVGGTGRDSLDGGRGDDDLDGGSGDEILVGGTAPGLDGGPGADVLLGGAGDDFMVAGPGADDLRGEAGSDKLRGDADADRLVGGTQKDVMNGGDGPDVLVARDGARDDVIGGPARDTARVDAHDVLTGVEVLLG